jgi:DNA-directed RNA polymerase subunit M/transcription elongation factor TFIIS
MPRNCPKCDALMEHQQEDPSVGIAGCWVCTNCEHVEDEEDYDDA